MSPANDTIGQNDPFNLGRFVIAQERIYDDVSEEQKTVYDRVLKELRKGRKETHWMWFIFPQFDGLGRSTNSKDYAIKSIEEARHYLNHPILGERLVECSETVLSIQGRSASEIFESPDDWKLKSSMTLFALVKEPESVFARVLDKYFHGKRDSKTLKLLEQHKVHEGPA